VKEKDWSVYLEITEEFAFLSALFTPPPPPQFLESQPENRANPVPAMVLFQAAQNRNHKVHFFTSKFLFCG
jgi:hypothetical protein